MKLKVYIINTLAALFGLACLFSLVGFAIGFCWHDLFYALWVDGYNCRYTWLALLIASAAIGFVVVMLLRQLLLGKWGR